MSQFVQGIVKSVKKGEGFTLLLLKRNDDSLFVVQDYRIGAPQIGEPVKLSGCNQIEDYIADNGTAYKQYSNEHIPDNSGKTLSIDQKGAVTPPKTLIEMTPERALIVASMQVVFEEIKGEAAPYFYDRVCELAKQMLK